jgi:hypothetical protein
MLIAFGGIAGQVMDMSLKVRILGSYPGIVMKMCSCLAGLALKIVCVQFIIHFTHPLLSIYAESILLDILIYKFTYSLMLMYYYVK